MDKVALDQGFAQLDATSLQSREAQRALRDWLVTSNEIQRLRINPYEVASATDAPVADVIGLALRGVAAGLFDLHWLVHCPHCNMITRECENFFELSHASECKMCEVDFGVDMLTRVEVTFSLNRAIEDLEERAFCLPPPALSPKVNIAVSPGGTVSGADSIDVPGIYRFFCPITLAKGKLEITGEPTEKVRRFSVRQLPSFEFDETSFSARPGPIAFELINDCTKVSVARGTTARRPTASPDRAGDYTLSRIPLVVWRPGAGGLGASPDCLGHPAVYRYRGLYRDV
jgi:hypothetical protein